MTVPFGSVSEITIETFDGSTVHILRSEWVGLLNGATFRGGAFFVQVEAEEDSSI